MLQIPTAPVTPVSRTVNSASFQAYLRRATEEINPVIEPTHTEYDAAHDNSELKYPPKQDTEDNKENNGLRVFNYEYDHKDNAFYFSVERNNYIIKSKQHPLEKIVDIAVQHKTTVDVFA